MHYKTTMIAIMATMAVLAVSAPALASGSGTRGGGGGGFSGGGFSQQRDPAKEAYRRGFKLFKKRITCKKCAYPKGVRDTVTAKQVAQGVRDGKFKLKSNERDLVLYFLSDRYSVR